MTAGDSAEGCMLPLSPGEILTVKDLFYSTLVGSMNNAARALARATDLNWDQFIGEMNNEAAKLGLSATHFNDPSGLDSANKSTAYEYARLSIEALRDFRLLQATTSKSYSFWTRNSGHFISMENTNKSLNSSLRITGGKTGYLPEANGGVGYNLMLKAKNRNDKEILVVVMGEGVYGQSFIDAENLAQWSFDNYQW